MPMPDTNPNKRYYEVVDLDGDERADVVRVNNALAHSYINVVGFDALQQIKFETEARNRYNEIGFEIAVEWEFVKSVQPGVALAVPTITILGKLYQHETDYDKIKHDTIMGKIDGVKGVIREDGSLHEEPKKKNIV